MLPLLAGPSSIYGAGMLELGMSFSMEQLVIDNDIIGMSRFAKKGIKADDETIAYDAIKEIGAGGDFRKKEEGSFRKIVGADQRFLQNSFQEKGKRGRIGEKRRRIHIAHTSVRTVPGCAKRA